MSVLAIPFNRHVGVEASDRPDFLLMPKGVVKDDNRLQTVRAWAQFSLSEALPVGSLPDWISRVIPRPGSLDAPTRHRQRFVQGEWKARTRIRWEGLRRSETAQRPQAGQEDPPGAPIRLVDNV